MKPLDDHNYDVPIIGINAKTTKQLKKEIKVVAVSIQFTGFNKLSSKLFEKFLMPIVEKHIVVESVAIRYRSDYEK